MRLLIDTHVFLWWDQRVARLAKRVRDLLADAENEVFVSAASVWEIAIKRKLGKLAFEGSVPDAVGRNGFRPLDVSLDDGELAGGLDWRHADPFDRLLVAQTYRRQLTFVTADEQIKAFPGITIVRAR